MSEKYLKALSHDFGKLFKDGNNYDVNIKVGEKPNIKIFRGHSQILVARSLYFKTAFSQEWVKKNNGIIDFEKPNMSPEIFEIILRYIYTGIIQFDILHADVLLRLLIALDELYFDDLLDDLQVHLFKQGAQWIRENFVFVYRVSLQYQKFTKLSEHVDDIIKYEPEILLESREFHELEESELLPILKQWQPKDIKVLSPRIKSSRINSKLLNNKQVKEIFKKIYVKKPKMFKSFPNEDQFKLILLEPTEYKTNCEDPTVIVFRIVELDLIIGGYNPFKLKYSSISHFSSLKAKLEYSFMFTIDNEKIKFVSILGTKDFNLKYNYIRPLNIFDFKFHFDYKNISYKQHFYPKILDGSYYNIEGLEVFKVIESD
ncbi:10452_t:CDS:2 [Dentiscutata heterogama]|uniref:10452_t:CDS:1 n=1 Tax=Dentiscutata heterogama TaxID=1316150 RepID=A0ACA9LMX7_9GLOM|nr:10452_t:CDS:2 [Dentiscutata heterogama]